MFELRNIELVHWDYWQRMNIPLDGKIITIIGPNGSGKTTLLDAIRTLLCIHCSQQRDYKQYVRHNKQPYAWIRSVTANERDNLGRRPFSFIMNNDVTIACRIKQGSGDWKREYCIHPGALSIEDLDKQATWMNTREYQEQIEGAGVSKAISKALSLEQGDTHKLCRYKPHQLLQLVFDAFGDLEVINNYNEAKSRQQEAQTELDELQLQVERQEVGLEGQKIKRDSYREWKSITKNIADLESEYIPVLKSMDMRTFITMRSSERKKEKADLITLNHDVEKKETVVVVAEQAFIEAKKEREDVSRQSIFLNEQAIPINQDIGRLEGLLERKNMLESVVSKQQGLDAEELQREFNESRERFNTVKKKVDELTRNRKELDERRQLLCNGKNVEAPFVRRLKEALNESGVSFDMLDEIVEIKDRAWHQAIEAVLRPYHHIVVLKRKTDHAKAMQIGREHQYQHYICENVGDVENINPGSIRSVVSFTSSPPQWLARLMNNISLVNSIDEGVKLGEKSMWILPDGYSHNEKGARFIHVSEFHFGKAGIEMQLQNIQQELTSIDMELAKSSKPLREAERDLSVANQALAGTDASKELRDRASEFQNVQKEYNEVSKKAETIRADLIALQERTSKVQDAYDHAKEAKINGESELASVEKERDEKECTASNERKILAQTISEYLKAKHKLPMRWRTNEHASEIRKMHYKSADEAENKRDSFQMRLDEKEDWQTDPVVEKIFAKMEQDFLKLQGKAEKQQSNLAHTIAVTDNARNAYIDHLRATLRKYGGNIKSLGTLANVDIDIEYPVLREDDTQIERAELKVRFNFDEKGFIGMDDGEASGGQQVIKSLILLMGTMMDASNTRGNVKSRGFISVDEPFAHLDIFNIDIVASFLTATGAQIIITAPSTNNVNVFKPSDIVIATSKKKSGELWAQPPAVIKRRTAGEAA